MLIIPIRAQVIRHVLNDPPIGPASLQRFKNLVKPLNAPFRAGKSAFLFKAWAGREDHIGKLAGFAEENVLHHEKFKFGKALPQHSWRSRRPGDFLAEQIHRLEFACMDRVDHLVIIQALGGRQFNLPAGFKTRAHFRVVDFW